MRRIIDFFGFAWTAIMLAMIANTAYAGSPVVLKVEPSVIPPGNAPPVIFSVTPSLPGMTITGIGLVAVNEQRTTIKELGQLTDDGLFGDRRKGDGVFSTQLLISGHDLPMRVQAVVTVADFPKAIYSDVVMMNIQ